MQMPSQSLDSNSVFEELVQEFPPEIEELAREFKAFARARKIKTVAQLLRIVMLYCGLDKSLREVAGNVTITIEQISDTAIANRLIACQAWIKALLPKMIDLPKLDTSTQRRLIVVDGSCVQGPGAKTTQYRLHIALNLLSLEIVEVLVTDKKTSESLINFHFQSGDIVIGDRGYGRNSKEIITFRQQGADLLLRYHSLLPLRNAASGKPLNIVKQLKGKSAQGEHSLAIEIKDEQSNKVVSGHLYAFKLPPEAAAKARRKIRAEAKKKKRTTRAGTLFLAGWLVIITTLPPTEFPAQIVAQLYRCRWQVEVAIKRFKSLLDADLLRAHEGSPLAQVWLNGKMLYVLVIERRTKRKCKSRDNLVSLRQQRVLTDWRLYKLIEDEIAPIITLVRFWPAQFSPAVIRALAERPRRRKLQTAPANLLLHFNAAIQTSKTISKTISKAA
jgi:hypothetical protein